MERVKNEIEKASNYPTSPHLLYNISFAIDTANDCSIYFILMSFT